MTAVIAHSLTSLGAPYVVRQAAAFIAEPPEATSRAIEAAVLALLEALAVAVSEARVLTALHALATDPANDGALLDNVAATFTMQNSEMPMMRLGSALIDLVFGADLPIVVRAVADRSGIRLVSAEALLRSIAPLALCAIGRQLRALPQQDEARLSSLLVTGSNGAVAAKAAPPVACREVTDLAPAAVVPPAAQATPAGGRVKIADRIALIVLKEPPPRLVWSVPAPPPAATPPVVTIPAPDAAAPAARPQPVPALPAVAKPAAVAPPAPTVAPVRLPAKPLPRPKDEKESRRGAVWPLVVGGIGALALIVGVPLLSWLARQDADSVQQSSPASGTAAQRTAARGYETPRPAAPRLNVELPEGSMERRLIGYIQSDKPLSNTDWFELDRINFQTGSHTLTTASADQIRNVAEVLKAFATVRLKIGGYTDNVGDPAKNLDLSTARANTVMYALVEQGISPSRLSAEGYGEQNPVADNATAEGRARNRRIAFRVLQR